MPVITLSRQMGSQGDQVAQAVAQTLGLRLVDRELINQAARAAGAPEIALAAIDELGLLGIKPSAAALGLYHQKVTEVIIELAEVGDVLLAGRGGQALLAGRPGVLHVRVIAPRAQRIATVQARCGTPAEAAAARVDASDKARAAYLRRYHGLNVDDPALYDLLINMAHLSVAVATELVCQAARLPTGGLLGTPQPAESPRPTEECPE